MVFTSGFLEAVRSQGFYHQLFLVCTKCESWL